MTPSMVPTLDEILSLPQYERETTYRRVNYPCGADPLAWPRAVALDFEAAERELRSRVGDIQIVSDRWACVPYCGTWWCARQIHYLRLETASVAAAAPGHPSPGAQAGSGAEDILTPSVAVACPPQNARSDASSERAGGGLAPPTPPGEAASPPEHAGAAE